MPGVGEGERGKGKVRRGSEKREWGRRKAEGYWNKALRIILEYCKYPTLSMELFNSNKGISSF